MSLGFNIDIGWLFVNDNGVFFLEDVVFKDILFWFGEFFFIWLIILFCDIKWDFFIVFFWFLVIFLFIVILVFIGFCLFKVGFCICGED